MEPKVSLLSRIFKPAAPDPRDALRPLYAQVVAQARQPHWYVKGGVPDTVDGRFEMVSAILSLILIRLERDSATAPATARLTELFVSDMDAQLREFGVGDMIVGKRVGKLMGAFGGRLGAYRDGLANGGLDDAIRRNLYGETNPTPEQAAHVAGEMQAIAIRLAAIDAAQLTTGQATW
ncbi:MAG: ubiquinol-cytochrome C chaperone family protein [Sphingorhabdus sp.]